MAHPRRLICDWASLITCAAEAWDGFICSRIKSHNDLSKFNANVTFFGHSDDPRETSFRRVIELILSCISADIFSSCMFFMIF